MIKRRSLLVLGMSLTASLCLFSDRGVGQEPAQLPPPGVLRDAPATHECWVGDAAPFEPVPTQWQRLWQFITFRQPPRPRECQGCINNDPSRRCVPPLYRYFENRFPTAN